MATIRLTNKEAQKLGIAPLPKQSKYKSNKVWVDGICFDSQLEANYYCELKIAQRAGQINGFCRQARFIVTEGVNGEKGTEYVADFIIFYPDGKYRIVDTKKIKKKTFKLKQKSFYEKYPKLKIRLEKKR